MKKNVNKPALLKYGDITTNSKATQQNSRFSRLRLKSHMKSSLATKTLKHGRLIMTILMHVSSPTWLYCFSTSFKSLPLTMECFELNPADSIEILCTMVIDSANYAPVVKKVLNGPLVVLC
jgi:hypothetical protein